MFGLYVILSHNWYDRPLHKQWILIGWKSSFLTLKMFWLAASFVTNNLDLNFPNTLTSRTAPSLVEYCIICQTFDAQISNNFHSKLLKPSWWLLEIHMMYLYVRAVSMKIRAGPFSVLSWNTCYVFHLRSLLSLFTVYTSRFSAT